LFVHLCFFFFQCCLKFKCFMLLEINLSILFGVIQWLNIRKTNYIRLFINYNSLIAFDSFDFTTYKSFWIWYWNVFVG
jgi:hypothetical protein